MKQTLQLLVLAFCTLLYTLPAIAQQSAYDYPIDPFARDLVVLTNWFEGEFDNEEQLWYQADPRSETPEGERHIRLHTMHTRLDLPHFGEHVFYVEEYKDNDPNDLVRQRLVLFTSEGIKGGIRMQQGFFKDREDARGAQFDPSKLADLTSEDVFFLGECDVFWHRSADQFEGQMRPKACVFGDGAERRYSVHNLILSEDKYWRVDATRLVSDDSLHVGLDESNPTRMRRAHTYICDVRIRLDDGPVQRVKGLRLHSQGGIQKITLDDNGKEYQIRLRDKEYPFYNTRPDFLFFSIHDQSDQRTLTYTVTDADARRVGVSSSGVSADCYRDGYTFDQPLEVL